MPMLRTSGLQQLLRYRDFINKKGGDISKKLNDPTVTNVLDHTIEVSDPKPWSDKQLHKLSKQSIINKSNENFLFEKRNDWKGIKEKLKEKSVDLVCFDGEQHKIDVEKLINFLKSNI